MATKSGSRSGRTLSKSLSHKTESNLPTEHQEQVAFIEWLKYQFPTVRYFSVPNGFFGVNFGIVQKLKKEGMQKGVMDIFLLEFGVAIEFKRQSGGRLSPEQKDWAIYFEEKCGLKVIVAHGCQDAVNQLMDYLTLRNNK